MIVKHFYYNEWQLGGDWEHTDHVFGAPDSDMQIEQNEKSIAASLEISDDEEGMEDIEDKGLYWICSVANGGIVITIVTIVSWGSLV